VRVKHEFAAYASKCFTPGRPVLEAVQALMSRIYDEFEFDPEATTVATPVLRCWPKSAASARTSRT
jgi:transglutaminase-like putative cysteine protease